VPVNLDDATVAGFGEEWSRFDQSELPESDLDAACAAYFAVFPWSALPANAVGMDIGCGSGRWAARVAPRVGRLIGIDASAAALAVARRKLAPFANATLYRASVDGLPVADGSLDFAYALGVLHHVPDTAAAIAACAAKLKPGAPLLLYLYYAFDQRPAWFRALWRATDLARRGIARLPPRARFVVADAIALGVYLPLARTAARLERLGLDVDAFPLSSYRRRSFYTMRTDALDRFGTRLERRFTRPEIASMMRAAGLTGIRFSDDPPYWCVVGLKADSIPATPATCT
jgi:SAM-dependent methyltransferase